MSEEPLPDEVDEVDTDLLPDDLTHDGHIERVPKSKGRAQPLTRKQKKAAEIERADDLTQAETAAKQQAARLAQIVNLHIAGYSLAQIGAAVGASAEEIDRLLASDTQRYVRNQPALRAFVRNWISAKYTGLLEAVWDEATDKTHREKLEHQDRALRILDKMARLHGAEAPAQSEVKVDAAPEAVERLVATLAAQQGQGYDTSIFDVVDAEVVHDAGDAAREATEVSGNAVEDMQEGEANDGF